jgi:hypothetical protein
MVGKGIRLVIGEKAFDFWFDVFLREIEIETSEM